MNFAFVSILLFLIITPGYLLRVSYQSSKLSVKNPNRNLVNELTLSIIPAFLIHSLVILLVECFSSYFIDFNQLGCLIAGKEGDNDFIKCFAQLRVYLWPIILYQLIVYSLSLILGFLTRKLVRELKWDRTVRFLRFSNKWHYIFSGECLDFPDVPDEYTDISEKIVDVLCKVNGETVLYTGILFNYYIDVNGDLEAIHIKYPMRRKFQDDGLVDRYYEIPSRYLVIPNSEILNINLKYFNIEELTAEQYNALDNGDILDLDNHPNRGLQDEEE